MASKNLTGENAHRMPEANSAGINIFESIYSMLNTKPETTESAISENLEEKTNDIFPTLTQDSKKLQKGKHLFENMNKNLFELMKGSIGRSRCKQNTVKSNTNTTSTVLEQNEKKSALKVHVVPNTDQNKNKITVSDKIDNQINNNMISSRYSDTKCLADTKTNHEINKGATETGCNNNESAFEIQPVMNNCTNNVNYMPSIKVDYDVNSVNKNKSVTGINKDKSITGLIKDKSITEIKDKSITGLIKDKSITGLIKDKSITRLIKDKSITGLIKDKSITGLIKDKSVTGINKDKTVTEINKDKIVTGINKDKIVTGINKDKIVTGINKDKIVTGINKDKTVTEINKDKIMPKINKDKIVTGINKDKIMPKINKDKIVTGINKDKSITESSIDHRCIHKNTVKKCYAVNVSNLKTNQDSVLEYEDPESLRIKRNQKKVTNPTDNQVLNCQDLNDQGDCEQTINFEDHINFDDFVILDEASSSDGEATPATIQTVSPKSCVLKQCIIDQISKQEKEAQSKKSHPDSLGSTRFNISQMSNISYLDVRDGFYSDISDEMGPDVSVEVYSDISEDEDVFCDMQKYHKYGKADIGKRNENCPKVMNFHPEKSGLNFIQEPELPSIRLKTRNYKTNKSSTGSHYLERHSEKTYNSKAFVRYHSKKKTCNSKTNHHSGRHPKSKTYDFTEGHTKDNHTAKEIRNSTAAHHREKHMDRKSCRLKEHSMHRKTGQSTGSESFKKHSPPRREPSSLKTKSSPKRVSKKKTNDFKTGKNDSRKPSEKNPSTLSKGDQFMKTIYYSATENHKGITNNLKHKRSKIRPKHSNSYKKLEKNVAEKLFRCVKLPDEKCSKAKSQIDQMILVEKAYHCPSSPNLYESDSDQSLSPSALIIVDEANSDCSHCDSNEEQYKIIDSCLDEPLADDIKLSDPAGLFNYVTSPCNATFVSPSHVHCESVITPIINVKSSFQCTPSVESHDNAVSTNEESSFQYGSSIEFPKNDEASADKESSFQCESFIESNNNEVSTNEESGFQCESSIEFPTNEAFTNVEPSFQSSIEFPTNETSTNVEPSFQSSIEFPTNKAFTNVEPSFQCTPTIELTTEKPNFHFESRSENKSEERGDISENNEEISATCDESSTTEINHDLASHPQLNSPEVNSARTSKYFESSAKENVREISANDYASVCEAESTILKTVDATQNERINTDSDKSVESSVTLYANTQNITLNPKHQTPNVITSSDIDMCGDSYDRKELHTNLITGSVKDCNNGNTSNNCIDPENGQNDKIGKHSCIIVELNANTAASAGTNNKNCSIETTPAEINSECEKITKPIVYQSEEEDIDQNSTGDFVLDSKSGKLKHFYFESEDKSIFDNLSNCAEIGKNVSSSEHIESNSSVKDTNNISYTINTNVENTPLASSNLSNSLYVHSIDLHKLGQLQLNIRTCKSDVAIAEYESTSEAPSRSSFNNTKSTNDNTHGDNTNETSDRMLEVYLSSNKTTSESRNTDTSISCQGSHSIGQGQTVQCITTDKLDVSPLENCLAKIPNPLSAVNTKSSSAILFVIQNNTDNANNLSVMSTTGSKKLRHLASGPRRAILPKPVDQHQNNNSNIAQTFTISKVSDTGLIEEKKKGKTKLVSESSESFQGDDQTNASVCPENYDKAKTIIKSKELNNKTIPVRMVITKSTARKSTSRKAMSQNKLKPLLQKALYMPPEDKIKDFKGRFLVGKVNGAFICFKCKSNFSESKQFRWHLWYHIHLNSKKCVTCNSTDPFQPCDTTDNLVETVSNLENEQIFFVMAKEDKQGTFESYKSLNTNPAGPTLPSLEDDGMIPELAPPLLISPPTTQQSSLQLQSPPILLPTPPLLSTLTNSAPTYVKTEPETQSHEKSDGFLAIKILNTFSLSTGEVLDSDSIDLAAGKSGENNAQSPQVSCTTLDPILDRSITPPQKSVRGEFFKCSMCNFSSLFETYFEEHIFETHGSSQTYKCFYCEFETLDKNTFIKHYGEHLNSVRCESLFVCDYPRCNVRANSLDHHLQHLTLHENWKPSCSQCNYTGESVNVISDHYKKFLMSLFSCPYCNAKAVDKHTYLQHVSQEHSLKARMVMVKKILVCNILKSFQAFDHSDHIDTSPAKPSPAPAESISSALTVRSPPTDVSFSTFLCQKCSFLCNDKTVFLYHKKLHSTSSDVTSDMPYTCPCCPDSFDSLDLMLPHLDHHDEDFEFGLFQCPLDGFVTNDKAKGKAHLSKLGHIKVNLFLNKVYFHKSKIYYCTLCGIRVKDRDIFMKHLFIHGKDSESVASMLQQPQYTEPITIYNPSFHRQQSLNTGKKMSSPPKKSPRRITKQQVGGTVKSPQQEISSAKKIQELAAPRKDVTSTEIQNNDASDTDYILDQTFIYENSVPKSKVFTSIRLFNTDDEQLPTSGCDESRINSESEKLSFLQEKESGQALMTLLREGPECNSCVICNKSFSRSSIADLDFKEHVLTKHLQYEPFKCAYCSFTAYSQKSFSVHCHTRHADLDIIIESRSITDMVGLLKQTLDIESNDYFETTEANDSCGSSNQPSNGVSPTSSYNCETCNTQFNCPFKLLRHKKFSHSKKPTTNTARKSTTPCSNAIKPLLHEASYLDKPSSRQIARKSTTNGVSKTLVSKLDKNAHSVPVKKFICQKCTFITEKKKKRSMIYHFKKHGFECFVECPHCQAKYTSLKLLLKHFELIHKGQLLEPKYLPIEDYFIPISESDLPIKKKNKQISSPVSQVPAFDPIIRESYLPFICVFCKLEEVKEEYMRYHLYIHLDYKPFGCGACSRTFSDTIQQRQHLTKHRPSDEQSNVVFKKLKIYEDQVAEIMRDCRRSVQADKNYQSWNLEVVQNDLLKNMKRSVEVDTPISGSSSENEMDSRTDVLSELLKISSRSISNFSSTDKTICKDANSSYIQAKAVEMHEENKISNRKTRSLSDYVSWKRKSFDENMNSISINKKLKMTNDNPIKKNIIESVFSCIPKESFKTSKSSVKRSIDCVSDGDLSKIPNYVGDYDSKHILCYYCSFTSESITAVISHTQQEHVGKRSAIGLLWIDTITGGTYDQEGHIFSNGFDREVNIEYPFLCGTCNYRATELSDVLQHEELNHLELKSSAVILVKKSTVGGGGRDRTISYFPHKRKRKLKEKVNTTEPTDAGITITAEDTLVSEVMTGGLKYNCTICSVVSNTEYHFRLHLASHDDFQCLVPDLSQNPQLKCHVCSYRAPDENKFTKHMMSHNGPELKYICGYCGFLADSTRSIKMHHRKRHPGQKFDITKFVDKKQTIQNLSLLVDFDPKVKLENFVYMSQDRFKYFLSKEHINFEK